MTRFSILASLVLCTILQAQLAQIPSVQVPVDPVVQNSASAAQDPDRAEAVVVIEFDGPALLRSRFRTTNLGSMLASKEAGDLWSSVLQPARQIAASLGDEVPAQMDALLEALTDHRGRIRIVVDLHAEQPAIKNRPRVSATIVVEPDGRTDLEAVTKMACRMLEVTQVPKIEIGPAKIRVAMFGKKYGVVLPQLIDGRLIFAASEDVASFVEAGFPAPSAATCLPKRLQKAALGVRLDFQRILPLFKQDQGSWPFDESGEFLEAFGFGSLLDVSLAVRTAGPRIMGEVSIGFGDGERGLFASMFPCVETSPSSEVLAPSGEDWQSGHFDLQKLFTTSYELAAAAPFGFDLESSVNEGTGVRLVEDLLAHMDTSYLELGSLTGRSDPEDGDALRNSEPRVCFAFGLKDVKAFTAAWKDCAETIQLWDTDPRLVEGIAVHQGSLFGLSSEPFTWAIVENQFVIAYGDDLDTSWVKGLIRRGLALKDQSERELTEEWKRLLPYAPPGHNGSGELDVIGLFRDVRWDLLEEFTGPALEGMTESVLRDLLPLMRRFEVSRGVTMTGHDGARWRYRVLW